MSVIGYHEAAMARMQAFSYPDAPAPRYTKPPRRPLLAWLVAAAIAAGGGLFLSPAPAAVVGSLTRLMAAGSPDGAQLAHATTLVQAGERALAAGQPREAVQRFAAALAIAPTLTRAYRRAQDASYLAGQPLDLAQLLPDADRRAALEMALADAALAKGDVAAALADADRAVHLAPQAPSALEARARALLAAGRDAEAIAAYRAASALRPQDTTLTAALIAAYYHAGQDPQAEQAALAAFGPLAAQDGSETVQVGLMEAYVRRGLPPQAVLAQVPAPATLDTAWRQVYLAEAMLRDYSANPNWHADARVQALASAQRAIAAAEDAAPRAAAQAIVARATAIDAQRAYDRADFAQAAKLLDAALALKAALHDPHELAALYVRRAHLEPTPAALEHDLEAALALVPDAPCRDELVRAYVASGTLALSLGKPAAALPPLARALALAPDDAPLAVRYAQTLVQAQAGDVLGHCARAIGGDREAAAALVARGLVATHQTGKLASLLGNSRHGGLMQAELALARSASAREALAAEAPKHPALWRRLGQIDAAIAETGHGAARLTAWLHARDDDRHALALADDPHTRGALLGCERRLAEAWLPTHARRAEREAERALILAPHNPQLSLDAGEAALRNGDYDRAAADFASGLEGVQAPADPARVRLCDGLGRALHAQRRYDEAIAQFKAALDPAAGATPEVLGGLYFRLAESLAAAGRREEALGAIRQYAVWSQHDPQQALHGARLKRLAATLGAPRG